MKSSIVSLVSCASYDPLVVQESVRQALSLQGGMTTFIKKGARVLVKPNALMAQDPATGIVTHPEVVRAVIRLLKEHGCSVLLGDSPSVFGKEISNVSFVYEKTGLTRVAKEEGVALVMFDKRLWRGKFPLTHWLGECDALVSIPKFKTHGLTIMTAGVKNLFGLVCGTYKTELHKNFFESHDFSQMLVELYETVRPALTIVDGVEAIEGNGPATSGQLCKPAVIAAASDCVALDSVLACVMGIDPLRVPTTRIAASRAIGVADMARIEVRGKQVKDVFIRPFILSSSSGLAYKLPRLLAPVVKMLIRYYPYVIHGRCVRCGACVRACPQKVVSMGTKQVAFDYRGCIACFCCQEVCPQAAIDTKKSFCARLLGL